MGGSKERKERAGREVGKQRKRRLRAVLGKQWPLTFPGYDFL